MNSNSFSFYFLVLASFMLMGCASLDGSRVKNIDGKNERERCAWELAMVGICDNESPDLPSG